MKTLVSNMYILIIAIYIIIIIVTINIIIVIYNHDHTLDFINLITFTSLMLRKTLARTTSMNKTIIV